MYSRPKSRLWIRAVQPEIGGIFNSTFPYGFNDGPVWAGRGVTFSGSAGLHGGAGPLEFVLAPQFFLAQNASFRLAPNGGTGAAAFRDPIYSSIDLPQRFGNGAYRRLDPGQSVVQVTLSRVSVGVSTANETWGPAIESPFLLGNNAAGFAHLFVGSDGPVTIGPLRLHLRVVAGKLQQSSYSPASPDSALRYVTGIVATGGVRQIPGLEVGLGRLFENVWPQSGLNIGDVFSQLVKNPLKKGLVAQVGGGGSEPDNQIGSLFARWVFPRSGIEVYGELGKEDNSYDPRDLLLEPDHDLAYMLGLQRVWKRARGALLIVRLESLNTSISHLERVRLQSPPYIHSPILQGHTQLGQVLGAASGYAGGSTSLALEWLDAFGRATLSYRRAMREPAAVSTSVRDVTQSLTVEGLLFRRRLDVAPELSLISNKNRNGAEDAFNLRLSLLARGHW